MKKVLSLLLFILFVFPFLTRAQLKNKLQHTLDSLQKAGNFTGLSMAVVYADNTSVALTAGYNDLEKGLLLKSTDLLMMGSVGKTYAAAIAMQLIQKNKLSLTDPVSKYLGHLDWYHRLPNAKDITVQMLLNHSSGIMRYEFKESFTKMLTANPDKVWKPEELLFFVLDEKAPFPAGEGWEYSDTNYILLGMIIEEITGRKFYDIVHKDILLPLKLHHTFPSDHRKLKGLAQGHAGDKNEFGGKDKVIDENGRFLVNPQFEWTGGGFYATTTDLAYWGKYLFEGKLFDSTSLKLMLTGVPAKLGKDTKYGLGAIIRPTTLGTTYGHSGFFPGYLTEMFYFPDHKFSIAVQTNSSDFTKIKFSAWRCLLALAEVAMKR